MRLIRGLMGFVIAAGLFSVFSAHAFERPFPAQAKRAKITLDDYPKIIINGKPRTLAAGARIWNQNNLTETPNALQGQEFTANYTEDLTGVIDRIWILTPEEAAKKRSSSKITE